MPPIKVLESSPNSEVQPIKLSTKHKGLTHLVSRKLIQSSIHIRLRDRMPYLEYINIKFLSLQSSFESSPVDILRVLLSNDES